jgi:anti-anti-sigma factor
VLDHNRLHSLAVATADHFDVRSELLPGGAAVAHVLGELDLATASKLEDALAELAPSADPVVVDLSECTFLDSAGMRVLLSAARGLAGEERSLRVVTADSRILRVLEITAVDTLIAVHPSVQAAL